MGYRCNSCMKFASIEDWEIQINGIDVDDTGHVTGDAEITLLTSCCSDQVAQASTDFEHEPGDTLSAHLAEHEGEEGHDLSVEEGDVETQDMYEPAGRPIRYQRHHYGFSMNTDVSCSCGETFPIEVGAYVQANQFGQM